MTFQELIEYCQTAALASKLAPDDEAVYRTLCRTYSEMFNTPLYLVKQMEPLDAILEVYEKQFSDIDVEENLEQILDMLYGLEDPDYATTKRNELKEFMKKAEEEEKKRIEEGRPIHKSLKSPSSKKTVLETPLPEKEKTPTGGSINLSYLEAEEAEEGFNDESDEF